jgi:hypothetical protein
VSGADPSSALQLINTIEKLPNTATGAYVFGPAGRPGGTILVENGRVCWAVAPQMGRRLTDLLRIRLDPSASPDALREVVRRCRLESTPLGEALVENGLLSSAALRDALRQHTSEAILILSQADGEPSWLAHRKQRYDARFTFSPAELLASIGAAAAPDLAEEARGEMERTIGQGGGGVAFAQVGASQMLFPICEVQGAATSVDDTIRLGEWGTGALEAEALIRAVPRLVAVLGATGDAIVTWSTGGVIYVVTCRNPSSLAHVLGKRARASPDGRSGS